MLLCIVLTCSHRYSILDGGNQKKSAENTWFKLSYDRGNTSKWEKRGTGLFNVSTLCRLSVGEVLICVDPGPAQSHDIDRMWASVLVWERKNESPLHCCVLYSPGVADILKMSSRNKKLPGSDRQTDRGSHTVQKASLVLWCEERRLHWKLFRLSRLSRPTSNNNVDRCH